MCAYFTPVLWSGWHTHFHEALVPSSGVAHTHSHAHTQHERMQCTYVQQTHVPVSTGALALSMLCRSAGASRCQQLNVSSAGSLSGPACAHSTDFNSRQQIGLVLTAHYSHFVCTSAADDVRKSDGGVRVTDFRCRCAMQHRIISKIRNMMVCLAQAGRA